MAIEGDAAFWMETGSLIVETVIVILLIKTVRDYAEVAKMSRLQTKQRFRPWVGPTSGIELLRTVDGKHQFSIAIKNFGEIPATNVVARSAIRNHLPSRQQLLQSISLQTNESSSPTEVQKELRADSVIDKTTLERSAENDRLEKLVLGPLLPNMEKRYWLFIDSSLMNNAKENVTPLFTFVHFSYDFHGGKSGYGMISQYDSKSGLFVHKDMWVD